MGNVLRIIIEAGTTQQNSPFLDMQRYIIFQDKRPAQISPGR